MAGIFYDGIQRIHAEYDGDASKIWAGRPKSGVVVRRFLEFKGAGIKIATMATNILAREFKIELADYNCIDVSPDVHVGRVFTRTGLVRKDASNEEIVYRARELNPEYPGAFDMPCWEIGTKWCTERGMPKCQECYLGQYCFHGKTLKN